MDESDIFHENVTNLFRKCGFNVEKRKRNDKGPDIIARAGNIKLIIQCKSTQNKGKQYNGLDDLIDAYSRKVDKLRMDYAILAFSGYSFPGKIKNLETGNFEAFNIKKILEEDRVLLLNDDGIEYLRSLEKAIGSWAKYPILAQLGVNKKIEKELVVDAIKAKQKTRDIFLFKIPASKLLKIADVLRKENVLLSDSETYQRMLNGKRLKSSIKEYINTDSATFPTNVVIAFNKGVKFKNGKLHIPMKYGTAFIVDGQHRLYGFCHVGNSTAENFELLCSGFNIENDKKSFIGSSGQADIFYNINENAKKMSTDLLLALSEQLGNTGDIAIKVASKLSSTVLNGRVEWKAKRLHGNIHITTLAKNSIMTRLIKDNFNDSPISSYYRQGKNTDPAEIYFNVLETYFKLIKQVFKKEWARPRKYIVFSDRGIRIFMRLFKDLLKYSNGLKDKQKAIEIMQIIKKQQPLNIEEFYGYAAGESGADLAYAKINNIIRGEITNFPQFPEKKKPNIVDQITIERDKKNIQKVKHFIQDKFKSLTPTENLDAIVGYLRFIDSTTFEYLKYLPKEVNLNFISGPVKSEDKEKVHKLIREFNQNGYILKVYELTGKKDKSTTLVIHEGPWIAGKNCFILLSTDLKADSIGNKKANIKASDSPENMVEFTSFTALWDQAEKYTKDEESLVVEKL
jgi:DNA sulfur modification protein DndB